jgi:hypothetical protein
MPPTRRNFERYYIVWSLIKTPFESFFNFFSQLGTNTHVYPFQKDNPTGPLRSENHIMMILTYAIWKMEYQADVVKVI